MPVCRSSSTPDIKGNCQGLTPSAWKKRGGRWQADGDQHCLVESTLFVAQPVEDLGCPKWEPFTFRHHRDGSVSFQSAGGELFLDADWRRPFLAAPWQPLRVSSAAADPGAGGAAAAGGQLFPFTLSYVPLQSNRGDAAAALLDVAGRRMVTLAAADLGTRSKWLASLQQKARSPDLRGAAPGRKPLDLSGSGGPRAGAPKQRRLAALGNLHVGLPSATRDLGDDAGAAAAEPCRASQQRRYAAGGPLRRHTFAEGGADGGDDFLEQYLGRQAEIERLLELRSLEASARPAPQEGAHAVECTDVDASDSALARGAAPQSSLAGAASIAADGGFQLLSKTPNARLEGGVLTNDEMSGGVLFMPPNESAFQLMIVPLDPLETNPLFIGIAPLDTDLNAVNFFDLGGCVLLCMGGQASRARSGGGFGGSPHYHAEGRRIRAELPCLTPGYSLSVRFDASVEADEGRPRFVVGDRRGEAVFSHEPELRGKLCATGWRPCVLLCMPQTRVRVLQLS